MTDRPERLCQPAFLYAITRGKAEAVRVLADHMDVNIDDLSGNTLLEYVYLLDQRAERERILKVVVPKLEPSFDNLRIAAKRRRY